MRRAIQIHQKDNVAVALLPLRVGEMVLQTTLERDIPAGHKFALGAIMRGDDVIKYGLPVGCATEDIPAGGWVHTHNVKTKLSEEDTYTYQPVRSGVTPHEPLLFDGYLRADGRAGVRNELWIVPTVGCVNDICKVLERECGSLSARYGLDGVYHFPHPYGCSQLGDDHAATRALLAALCRHPNAGGVLVVGLGCENNNLAEFKAQFEEEHLCKMRFMTCQDEADELALGAKLLEELAQIAAQATRQILPASKLVIGMKCGGSDGLSGITANPAVGAFSDMLISMGGTTILTEVPEMFGAETLLFNRCKDEETFQKAASMVDKFKRYFISNGQPIYENPSPGNKDGGITTLEEKSAGCIQKGGFSPVADVLNYAEPVMTQGLNLLYGPGNDLVSATALAAAGAQLISFTTGRGTPFGAPVPTLKISSNTPLFLKKSNWIDFNAGTVAEGEPIFDTAKRLMEAVLLVASGRQKTHAEELSQRGIAIWKNGVTL